MLVVSETGETDKTGQCLPSLLPQGSFQSTAQGEDSSRLWSALPGFQSEGTESRVGNHSMDSSQHWVLKAELPRGRNLGLCARSLECSAEHAPAHRHKQVSDKEPPRRRSSNAQPTAGAECRGRNCETSQYTVHGVGYS